MTYVAAPATEEECWESRISGPGVVWYHNFDSAAEVNAFRWSAGFGGGNDPNDIDSPGYLSWISNDGFAGGGCMQRIRDAGTTENVSDWWRPFSPFAAPGNGRTTDDPGANNTIAVQGWAPTSGGSQTNNYPDRGYYGNATYHTGSVFDGTEYWLQVRVKMDPNRAASNNPEQGKLFYFTRTDASLTNQEIVTFSAGTIASGRNYFGMYRSGGATLSGDAGGSATVGDQVGGSIGLIGEPTSRAICRFNNTDGKRANCWAWPDAAEWVTLLYHIRPGLDSGNDTLIQVFVAEFGDLVYRRIWHQTNVDLPYGAGRPFGHNAVICSSFTNGLNVGTAFYHRWTQMIFSKEFIPCPKVY